MNIKTIGSNSSNCPECPVCEDKKCPECPVCEDKKCPECPVCEDKKCPECPVCEECKNSYDSIKNYDELVTLIRNDMLPKCEKEWSEYNIIDTLNSDLQLHNYKLSDIIQQKFKNKTIKDLKFEDIKDEQFDITSSIDITDIFRQLFIIGEGSDGRLCLIDLCHVNGDIPTDAYINVSITSSVPYNGKPFKINEDTYNKCINKDCTLESIHDRKIVNEYSKVLEPKESTESFITDTNTHSPITLILIVLFIVLCLAFIINIIMRSYHNNPTPSHTPQ